MTPALLVAAMFPGLESRPVHAGERPFQAESRRFEAHVEQWQVKNVDRLRDLIQLMRKQNSPPHVIAGTEQLLAGSEKSLKEWREMRARHNLPQRPLTPQEAERLLDAAWLALAADRVRPPGQSAPGPDAKPPAKK